MGIGCLTGVLYLTILIAFPCLVDISSYKAQIENEFKNSTGFGLSIESITFKPEFSPFLNIHAHHLKLMYPNGESCLKIRDADVKLRVLPVLFKQLVIQKVALNRPILSFALYKDCSTSIERDYKPSGEKPKFAHGFVLSDSVPEVIFNRYKVKVYDQNYFKPFILEGTQFKLSDLKLGKSVHFSTKGVVSQGDVQYINYDLDVNSKFLQKNGGRFFKVDPFKSLKKYSIGADVFAHIDIDTTGDYPAISGKASLKNLSIFLAGSTLRHNSVILDFAGHNIGILANIMTELNRPATIDGEVEFGKNKKVDLRVKAPNVRIENLHQYAIAALYALNIKNNLKDYKCKGIADLDFYVKTDLKKVKSSGVAKIVDASVENKKYPCKISGINSTINFSDNEIKITKTKALVNATPLTISGSVLSDATMNIIVSGSAIPVKNLLTMLPLNSAASNFILENGLLSFDAKLSGKMKEPDFKVIAALKNLSFQDKANTVNGAIPLTRLNFAYFDKKSSALLELLNSKFKVVNLDSQITSPKISLKTDKYDLLLTNSKLIVDGSTISAVGVIKKYLKKPDADLKLVGKINSQNLYSHILKNYKLQACARGSIPFVAHFTGNANDFSIEAQGLANSSNYISALVIKELLNKPSLFNLALNSKNGNVDISDCSIYKLSKTIKLSDDFSSNLINSKRIIFVSGGISSLSAEPAFNNLKVELPEGVTCSISNLKGSEISLKSSLVLNGSLKAPKLSGNAAISKISVPQLGLKATSVTSTFDNSNIYINAPAVKLQNSAFSLSATASPSLANGLLVKNMSFSSKSFNLQEVASLTTNIVSSLASSGIRIPVQVQSGKASLTHFTARNIEASNINANFSLKDNVIKIRKMTSTAYFGKVWGNIDYIIPEARTKLTLSGTNLDAAPAILALIGLDDNIGGKMNFSLNTSMVGFSRYDQFHSINGHMNFNIHNGQFGTMGKFEHFLYAQNLVSQNIMRATVNVLSQAVASKNTGRFRYLRGDVTFNSGYAYVKSVASSGPNMSLLMSGNYNMLANWADLDIMGKVSKDVMNVLGPIGEISLSGIVHTNNGAVPNLFFASYNLPVSQSVIDRIPPLTPQTMLKNRNFIVKIYGNPQSVKAVKMFKWLVSNSEMQQAVYRQEHAVSSAMPSHYSSAQSSPSVKKNSGLPSFMNKLPDKIK